MPTPIKWNWDFVVNSTTQGDQRASSVTALAGGGFVVAWTDASGTSTPGVGVDLRLQVFSALGLPVGLEVALPADPSGERIQPSVAALPDGGFALVWTSGPVPSGGPAEGDILLQRFAPDGSPVSPPEVVNTTTAGLQHQPVVAALPDGGLLVTWTSRPEGPDADGTTGVMIQAFDAQGARLGEERSITPPDGADHRDPSLAATAEGEVMLTWTTSDIDGEVMVAKLDSRGYPTFGPFFASSFRSGSQIDPAIASLADGAYVATWTDESSGTPVVQAQVFDRWGTPRGEVISVGAAGAAVPMQPEVVALPDGNFLLAWATTPAGFMSGGAIWAQLYDRDGQALGVPLKVNGFAPFEVWEPSFAVLADGRVVATWTDSFAYGTDGSGTSVKSAIIDPRTAAVTLNGTTLDDDLVGTAFADLLSGSEGEDWLAGGAGDDQLWGEEGADNLDGGAGNDQISGGEGNDHLVGGAGSDRLLGGDGQDWLVGGAGGDRMEGGAGDDQYMIDSAQDRVVERAGEGIDVIYSDRSVDLAQFANVEDVRLLGADDLMATGTAGANVLQGNDGDNLLSGGAGKDRLFGGLGDDRLRGGAGNDQLSGEEGADVFVFDRRGGRDLVYDFTDGVDRLDLSAFDFASARAVRAVATQVGDDLVLKLAAGVTVTLHDMTRAQLGADDLIL